MKKVGISNKNMSNSFCLYSDFHYLFYVYGMFFTILLHQYMGCFRSCRSNFPYLSDWFFVMCILLVRYGTFSNIPGLYPVDAGYTFPFLTIKNISRYCQLLLGANGMIQYKYMIFIYIYIYIYVPMWIYLTKYWTSHSPIKWTNKINH